jgi:hypothetical protein
MNLHNVENDVGEAHLLYPCEEKKGGASCSEGCIPFSKKHRTRDQIADQIVQRVGGIDYCFSSLSHHGKVLSVTDTAAFHGHGDVEPRPEWALSPAGCKRMPRPGGCTTFYGTRSNPCRRKSSMHRICRWWAG